jgi:hypothetical protein
MLLKQGYVALNSKSSLPAFCDRYHELVDLIVLSVLLRFKEYDYPFGIFTLFEQWLFYFSLLVPFNSLVLAALEVRLCYSIYKLDDKSSMRKGLECIYDKWNISVVILMLKTINHQPWIITLTWMQIIFLIVL